MGSNVVNESRSRDKIKDKVRPIVRRQRISFGVTRQEEEDITQETIRIILERSRNKGIIPSDPYIGRTAYFEARKICKRILKRRSREEVWDPSKFDQLP